ncbi:MAG: hypothetical protein GY751_18865 [Bacteroidetes bacterium]|nr:hypothetical protein [Bacteroidota bacterium]
MDLTTKQLRYDQPIEALDNGGFCFLCSSCQTLRDTTESDIALSVQPLSITKEKGDVELYGGFEKFQGFTNYYSWRSQAVAYTYLPKQGFTGGLNAALGNFG